MWNYRLIRTHGKYPDHMISSSKGKLQEWSYIALHEVYYTKDGEPDGCTKDSISIGGDTLEDIRATHEMMADAFDKPILDMNIFEYNDDSR